MSRKVSIKELKKKKIGVIMGGWSSEREISLLSGRNILESLKRQGFDAYGLDLQGPEDLSKIRKENMDVAFIILHGKPGEDGTIQGYLELLGIPYTGSGVEASAIGMDKILTKKIFKQEGIPTPPWVEINPSNIKKSIEKALKELGLPLILKPRREGSSVGVKILKREKEILPEVKKALSNFEEAFLEKYIPGVIATVGILRDQVLPILELRPKTREFYDYEAKYTKGETEFIIPAQLPKDVTQKIKKYAYKGFKAIGCRGFARLDLVVKERKYPYFLEINTLPGMTDLSDLPAEAKAVGLSYDDVVLEILKDVFH